MITPILSGCAQVHSNYEGLSVIEYSKDKQNKAADEIESGYCPVLNEFISDYSVLRDQARVK